VEKIRPIETILEMGKGKIKENDGGGKFKHDIICYIVRTFVNGTMYSQHNKKKIKMYIL
jgi:hypothetical protein